MNKIAFVIGGSSGIGLAVIKILLNDGYTVYNASRRPCPDERVKSFSADVTKFETIKQAIDIILKENERIDVFIYSAGYSMASPLEYSKFEELRYLFDVNFFGAAEAIKELIPYMKNQGGGRIISISSVASSVPIPYDSFYSASKAALDGLCFSLRAELQKFNIKITSVLPGGTNTEFSLKRNITKVDNMDSYSEMNKAIDKLYDIEQSGMEASSVAKTVFRMLKKRNPPVIIASGIINKFYLLLSKILPEKLILKILRYKYFK